MSQMIARCINSVAYVVPPYTLVNLCRASYEEDMKHSRIYRSFTLMQASSEMFPQIFSVIPNTCCRTIKCLSMRKFKDAGSVFCGGLLLVIQLIACSILTGAGSLINLFYPTFSSNFRPQQRPDALLSEAYEIYNWLNEIKPELSAKDKHFYESALNHLKKLIDDTQPMLKDVSFS